MVVQMANTNICRWALVAFERSNTEMQFFMPSQAALFCESRTALRTFELTDTFYAKMRLFMCLEALFQGERCWALRAFKGFDTQMCINMIRESSLGGKFF